MLFICNKRDKKLFLTPAAIGAVAVHAKLGVNNLKIFDFTNISLYQAGQGILKFNNLTAAKTGQVVMLGRGFYLVVVVCLIKVKLLY